MPRKIRTLKSVSAVIDALGGPTVFGSIIGRRKQSTPYYRKQGRFPPETYFTVNAALKRRGYSAPRSLFGFDDPGKMRAVS